MVMGSYLTPNLKPKPNPTQPHPRPSKWTRPPPVLRHLEKPIVMFGSLTFMGIKVGMGMKVTYDGYVYGHQWLGMGMKVGIRV